MTTDIAYASTDADCIAIHRFLCIVAQPVLQAPVDPDDSIAEILRVRDEGVALVALINGELVGTLGLTRPAWWYNKKHHFFTDRWFFVLPNLWHLGIGTALEAEAAAIARGVGERLIINGHMRTRNRDTGGVLFTRPKVYTPEADEPPAAH